ncbi:MAG: urea transporter [Magnetococcales bacterium]|nr:urea transporter [Magnetococcales bacterium]
MDSRFLRSFATSVATLARASLAGMAELALCRRWWMGLPVLAAVVAFSPAAGAAALLGAVVATLWPFWRQRDLRLLNTGWYGANGALCGFLVEWHFTTLPGVVLITLLGALLSALLLDRLCLPMGDAPLRLPPLTLPFLVLGALLTATLPAWHRGLETLFSPTERFQPATTPAAPLDPERAIALAEGWRLYAAGEYTPAGELFLASPDRAEFRNGLGWVRFRQGRDGEAVAAFQQALEGDAAQSFARLGLAWSLYRLGGFEAAGRHFRQIPEHHPANSEARNGLGWLALREHHAEEALTHFALALAADPRSASAREGQGRAYLLQRQGEKSEAAFRELLNDPVDGKRAIQGLADARRVQLLHGQPISVDPREWQALETFLSGKWWGLPLLAAGIVWLFPSAGLLALGWSAIGLMLTVALAGPASVLWIDLHLQSITLVALLIGKAPHRAGLSRLFSTGVVVVASVLLWAGIHRLGLWLPLLPFHIAGLAALLWVRPGEERFLVVSFAENK